MKHTDIRAAVLDALEQHEHGATLFDGPLFLTKRIFLRSRFI